MNKRAKKRLIEKIAKDKQDQEKLRPEPNLSPPKPPHQPQRGFLPKPEKKRG